MAITPQVGQTHDITITAGDSGAVTTGYILWRDSATGAPALRISRAAALAQQRFSGLPGASDKPPQDDMHWTLRTFSEGALSFRWTPEADGRYNESDGVDATQPNELSLTNRLNGPFTLGVPDPSFENWSSSSALADWTEDSGITIQRMSAADAHSGNFALGIDTDHATLGVSFAVSDHANYRTSNLHVGVWVKRPSTATETVTVHIRKDDGVAEGSVVSQALTTSSTTYQFVSGTVSVSGSSTKLTITINVAVDTETDTPLAIFDDVMFATSGSVPLGNFMEYKDNLYVGQGLRMTKWTDTNDHFAAVLDQSGTGALNLGISPTDDALIAGDSGDDNFWFSTDGTSWTEVAATMGGPYAQVNSRIWGRRDDDTIESSVDMNAAPTVVSYNDIGTTARAITGIFAFDDIVVVGKEDGLWVYRRRGMDGGSIDAFEDITPEFQAQPSTDNFTRGLAWGGWLYLNTRNGILRFNGDTYQDVTPLFTGPSLTDFGGRVRAFASDSRRAYVLMDTPTADATVNKETWLLSFREVLQPDGSVRMVVHTHFKFNLGDLSAMTVFHNGTDAHLYIIGRYSNGGTKFSNNVHRIKLPAAHESPARDITPDFDVNTAGTLITQYWDGGFPSTTKTFSTFDIRLEGADSGKTVLVAFQVDDDSSFTALGTVSSNGLTTLDFAGVTIAKRSGTRIRFKFTLSTDSTTAGPRVLMPMTLHAAFRPTLLKHYQLDIEVGSPTRLLHGGQDSLDTKTLIARLDGYLEDKWVIIIKEDEDRDGTVTSHEALVNNVDLLKQEQDDAGNWTFVYRLTATARHV